MSRVGTGGWETGHPYAVNYYNPVTIAYLGTPVVLGRRLQWPVDMSLAHAEAIPVTAHDGLDKVLEYLTLASMSSQMSGEAFNSVAVAALVTNGLMPKEIQHTHPEIWSNKVVVGEFAHQIDQGLAEASLFIQRHQESFGDYYQYQLAVLRLANMYAESGQNMYARQYRLIGDRLVKKE